LFGFPSLPEKGAVDYQPQTQPRWPLWILGATLIVLLVLAVGYWINPELLAAKYPFQKDSLLKEISSFGL